MHEPTNRTMRTGCRSRHGSTTTCDIFEAALANRPPTSPQHSNWPATAQSSAHSGRSTIPPPPASPAAFTQGSPVGALPHPMPATPPQRFTTLSANSATNTLTCPHGGLHTSTWAHDGSHRTRLCQERLARPSEGLRPAMDDLRINAPEGAISPSPSAT